jgi:Peptide-N-glycosidase F, C terminal
VSTARQTILRTGLTRRTGSAALVLGALLAFACSDSSKQPASIVDAGPTHDDSPDAAPPATFLEGPYGWMPRDVAGPFTVETSDGPLSFRDAWTGDDHWMFMVYAPGTMSTGAGDYSTALFKGSAEVKKLIEASPKNVHYVFLWYKDQPGFDAFRKRAQAVIDALPESDGEHWRARFHFVTPQADKAEGWVGDVVRNRINGKLRYVRHDPFQFAVDSTQHVREVGMLGKLTTQGQSAELSFLASEPVYYEYERARDAKLASSKATVVELLKDQSVVDEAFATIDLPDPATMESFDSLEVDLKMDCVDHRDGECPAWDYIADLRLCEEPSGSGGTGADDAGVDAGPPKPKCETEIARWITSYWREARWVTDISGMLPLLKSGKQKLRWWASEQWDPKRANYVVSLSFRFSNKGKGMRPFAVQKLWNGGALDSTYSDKHPPRTFTVPDGTKKVEVFALITGHGADTEQCAEFCNHTHHFSVNGTSHDVAFPEARTPDGCRERVSEGVAPNQFGTWYFGRGGWCPGLDVRPYVADVTSNLKSSVNEVAYSALVGTRQPEPDTKYGNINLSSYLVFWR